METKFDIPVDTVLVGEVVAISMNDQYIRIKYNLAFGDVYLGDKGNKYKLGDKVEFIYYGNKHVDNLPILTLFDGDWFGRKKKIL